MEPLLLAPEDADNATSFLPVLLFNILSQYRANISGPFALGLTVVSLTMVRKALSTAAVKVGFPVNVSLFIE
jgi:hypothetical protein